VGFDSSLKNEKEEPLILIVTISTQLDSIMEKPALHSVKIVAP